MSFFEKIRLWLARVMSGRNGVDELGLAALIVGLVLSMIDNYVGIGILSLIGLGLYIYAIYRMFSRNVAKRQEENAKYNAFFAGIVTKVKQWWVRQKNRKEYKYYRCPHCRSLMRQKRGTGEKHIVCPKCKHEFDQKA